MESMSMSEIVALSEDRDYAAKLIDFSGVFQKDYYRKQYIDSDDIEPISHYCEVGHLLNMNPSPQIDGFKIKSALKADSHKQANPLAMFILYRIYQAFPFDAGWYSKTYRLNGESPVEHFNRVGLFEGNYPNGGFNDADYIEANPDLKDVKISRLIYHALKGGVEGRKIKKQRNRLPLSDDLQHAREQITKLGLFDERRYLALYPDIDESGVDPLDHYLVQGWTESRSPSTKFDPVFYLEIYRDVKEAGVNPLAHFAVAGRAEGRQPMHPEKLRLGRIDDVYVEIARKEKVAAPKLRSLKVIPKLSGRVVVSFSHDQYYKNNGGIQLVIRQEEYVHSKGGTYLHVCPVYGNDQIITISINGRQVGNFYVADALKYLTGISPDAVLVHHIKGFDEAFLNSVFASYASVKERFFWLHDYYAWCENHLLMRNGISYCDAPAPASSACDTCAYGEGRPRHLDFINGLLTTLRPTLISPSDYPLKKFVKDFPGMELKGRVRPHLVIDGKPMLRKKESGEAEDVIKIGFLGEPVFHKGWNDFLRLLDELADNPGFQFYVFSSKDPQDHRVHYMKTTLLDYGSAAKTLMEKVGLDYLLFLSKWPETFGLSVLEGLAAGAHVICYKDVFAVEGNRNIARYLQFVESYEQLREMLKGLAAAPAKQGFRFRNQMAVEYWGRS